ncbi:hypothetical protein F9Z84_06770 [Escherichia coli]|nr:hypothetical protein F9Z84_06770 [Escherichia coli]
MPNDSRIAVAGKITFAWNPFQDNPANRVTDEAASTNVANAGIIIPRNGPFFSRDVKVTLTDSNRELSFEAGDYSFIHPFGRFNKRYNRLVWGGIQLKNVTGPVNVTLEYDTIGGDFVLSDIAYAEAVANVLTSPRTIDWDEIVNLPLVWPPDPHDQPASDTMNYGDMIVYMTSYIDALTQNPSLSWMSQFQAHLDADLQDAHKGTLDMLGVKNLGDWAMAKTSDIKGNSTELIVNVATLKEAIRAFARGEWS